MTPRIQSRPDGYAIAIGVRVEATPERAFSAWTHPDALDTWFTTGSSVDLRIDGEYRNADGDHGRFLAIDPPHLLRFTWEQPMHEPGSEVSIEFLPIAGGTEVMLHHQKLNKVEEAQELLNGGWRWALDSLKQFLETGDGIRYEEWKRQTANA